jgi:hypothetical protein
VCRKDIKRWIENHYRRPQRGTGRVSPFWPTKAASAEVRHGTRSRHFSVSISHYVFIGFIDTYITPHICMALAPYSVRHKDTCLVRGVPLNLCNKTLLP